MKLRIPTLFSRGLWRALLEGSLVMALWMLPVAGIAPYYYPGLPLDGGVVLAAFLGALVFVLRWRWPRGSWKRRTAGELLGIVLFAAVFMGLKTGLAQWIGGEDTILLKQALRITALLPLNLAQFGLALGSVLGLRLLALGIYLWRRAGQRRFMWQVAGVFFLTVTFIFSGLLLLFQMLAAGSPLTPSGDPPLLARLYAEVVGRLPVMVLISGAFLVGLVFLVPFVLPFSFFVARRLTRRVSRLAQAASILRGGDLSARVQVDGQDELAELQQTFNQMAEQLQHTTAELQGERDKLAAALDGQRRLTAGISHELRTPLAAVRGYAEAGLEASPSPALRRSLDTIQGQSAAMERILADLLTLSRSQANALSIQLAPTDAGAIVRRVSETLAPLAWRQKKVEVSAQAEAKLPLIQADPERLEQVLNNLVQNAIRVSSPGGIVALQAAAQAGCVRIAVADSGPGIPAADLEHIWERFFQSSAPELRGSAGLGLALVKELSEAMGARVGVESAPGEGSRFWVEFKS